MDFYHIKEFNPICINVELTICRYFYPPTSIDWGYIVFGQSVCRSRSVCLSAKTFTLAIAFEW